MRKTYVIFEGPAVVVIFETSLCARRTQPSPLWSWGTEMEASKGFGARPSE